MSVDSETVDLQEKILEKISNHKFKRKDVSVPYAVALGALNRIVWSVVNQTIRERWSYSGLNFIKDRAWKIAERKVTP